jgi:hypothetical protein
VAASKLQLPVPTSTSTFIYFNLPATVSRHVLLPILRFISPPPPRKKHTTPVIHATCHSLRHPPFVTLSLFNSDKQDFRQYLNYLYSSNLRRDHLTSPLPRPGDVTATSIYSPPPRPGYFEGTATLGLSGDYPAAPTITLSSIAA